ncbi:MAG TPA: LuxR C-terminal-related transcriptional regulator, partial [Candidatus Thermoplasmatota archaeon]|nr:LuxR C-terminal-related transcriptional regulator [Candidatus Thermoplasmatota archaeon]
RPAPDGAVHGDGQVLSARQREVAALIAQGLTNREIAKSLVITEGTVATHVMHILNKLGLTSRVQIATWAVREGLSAGA